MSSEQPQSHFLEFDQITPQDGATDFKLVIEYITLPQVAGYQTDEEECPALEINFFVESLT